MTVAPGPGRACQPGACFAKLQAAQSPCPLSMLVVPPSLAGMTWSTCRMGASHQGVRQVWSRRAMNLRWLVVNNRRRVSMATSWPVSGWLNSLRSQTGAFLS